MTQELRINGMKDVFTGRRWIYKVFAREPAERVWHVELWTADEETARRCNRAVFSGKLLSIESRPTEYGPEIVAVSDAQS